ncbi:hypothetical protein BD413DRAFT_524584 [Trametes elegans]|nr:hypothetical protein BD413DRAFT_524584 [Trametes elegans]
MVPTLCEPATPGNAPERRSCAAICPPVQFREWKQGHIDPLWGLNMYICTRLRRAGHKVRRPPLALATVPTERRLFSGWVDTRKNCECGSRRGERTTRWSGVQAFDVVHHVNVYVNGPDFFDTSAAMDFRSFFALLRTRHILEVMQTFEDTQPAFVDNTRPARMP